MRAALSALCLALLVPAQAQKPTAARVMDGYVNATGGKAAYARLKTVVMEGAVEMKAQGVRGTMKVYMQAPDRFYAVQNVQGIGEIKMAFDGRKGWSKDPFMGLRDMSGPELEMNKLLSAFAGPVNWRTLYRKVEVTGAKSIDGVRCHVVKLTPKAGKPLTGYYDARNFLLYRLDLIMESPQGAMPTQVVMKDYRSVGGVKMPYVMVQKVANVAEVSIRVTAAKANVPVDSALFRKPAN